MNGRIFDGRGSLLLDFLFRNFNGYFFFDRVPILSDKQENTTFTGWNWAGCDFTGFSTLAGEGLSGHEFQWRDVFCKGLSRRNGIRGYG